MKWYKVGARYHAARNGSLMCLGCKAPEGEGVDDPPWEERCQNCDSRMRKAGRATKPHHTHRPNKAVYRPRNVNKW